MALTALRMQVLISDKIHTRCFQTAAYTHTPFASVILGLKENMHGWCLLSGHWFGRGHSAAVGTESCCSCLAWPEPGWLLKKPGSAGEAGYQLNVVPSVLSICQGKRDVRLEHVWREAKFNDTWNSRSDSSVCAYSQIGVPVFVQPTFSPHGPGVFYWPIHLLCTYCSLWVHMVLTHSYVVLSFSLLGHIFINL